MKNKRIIIIGATSAIAEHCARTWVAKDVRDFVLVGRSKERLDRVASDLKIRASDCCTTVKEIDFFDPRTIQTTADQIAADGPLDIVLIAHGLLPDQLACQTSLEDNKAALEINGISPVLFAEAFVGHMEKRNSGTLAIIGSVAGDRGRKSNYVYGAAKCLIDRYAQGLQHRLARSEVKVVLIKPGPTDTPMTASLKQQGARLSPVEMVAGIVVNGIEKNRPTVYAPRVWKLIMLIIRHLPTFAFNRLNI